MNMAMASFTRLRPSRMPARKNSVRRCGLTVRGLILSWPANLLVTAALHQQIQNLLVAGCDFDLIQVDHGKFLLLGDHSPYHVARSSPILRIPAASCLSTLGQ